MTEVYLDNDVSLELSPLLRRADHGVTATRDLGLFRATDDAQLLLATRHRWMLISYNRRDFTLLHDAWLSWPAAFGLALPAHAGILILDPASPETLANAVDAFITVFRSVSLENQLFWWHRQGRWDRRIVGSGWEPPSRSGV